MRMRLVGKMAVAGVLCVSAAWAQEGMPGDAGRGRGPQGMQQVAPAEAERVLKAAETTHPKFTAQLEYAEKNDPLLKNMHWVRADLGPQRGPAFASPMGFVTIDLNYLDTPKPAFDDNRMVVVLWHEIGHLHYFVATPPAQRESDRSEQAAFEYSLKVTKELAEKGDCGPLRAGVFFMKMRSEGTDMRDAHVRALKRIVLEPMYADYAKYVAETLACKTAPDPARLLGPGGALPIKE